MRSILLLFVSLGFGAAIIPLLQSLKVVTKLSDEAFTSQWPKPPQRDLTARTTVVKKEDGLQNITKNIWMFWDQGRDDSRYVTDKKCAADIDCVEATIRLRPDWSVRVLDIVRYQQWMILCVRLSKFELESDGWTIARMVGLHSL